MTWWPILALAAGAYALKAIGPVVVGRRTLAPDAELTVGMLAIPVLAALTLLQTVDSGHASFAFDARIPAVGVVALLVWLRAPFIAVVVGAAITAALIRLASG